MDDSVLYEYALEEVESDSKATGLWAKAIANSDGNTDKAKSIYMKYRVDGIRNEFDSFGIDYSALTVVQVASYIDDAFRDEKWRNQVISEKEDEKIFRLAQEENERRNKEKEIADRKQQEELDAEKKKYSKIGGWLTPFSIFLAIWTLSAIAYPFYTVTDGIKDINSLLASGETNFVRIIEYELYLQLIWQFFSLLLAIFFFKKLKGTKAVAIIFFIAAFVISVGNALLALGFATTDVYGIKGSELLETGELGRAIVLPVILLFLGVISILYFLKSERVEKTFRNLRFYDEHQKKKGVPKSNSDLVIYAAVLPIILLATYHNQKNSIDDLAAMAVAEAELAFMNKQYSEGVDNYLRAKNLGLNETGRGLKKLISIADELLANKKYKTAEKLYIQSARLSSDISITAQYIADQYFDNDLFQQASSWYQKAVDQGNITAMFRLAYSYDELEKYDLAIKYYKEYNDYNESAGALYNLSRVYMEGKKDCNNAITYARQANKLDSKYGGFVLGYCHHKLGYYKAAIKYFKSYIQENPDDNSWAQLNIAQIYAEGPGKVQKNEEAAFKYYLGAARQGNKVAMEKVYVWYLYGIGIEKNVKKSNYWKNKSRGS